MTEQAEGVAAPKVVANKSGGRGIAVFAFIVAICALALGAYLGYRLVYLQPFAAQTQQVEELVAATEQKILASWMPVWLIAEWLFPSLQSLFAKRIWMSRRNCDRRLPKV